MPRFQEGDLRTLETAATSPASLRSKITALVMSSVRASARVESINLETGEYRVILHGVLDLDAGRRRRW